MGWGCGVSGGLLAVLATGEGGGGWRGGVHGAAAHRLPGAVVGTGGAGSAGLG